MNNVSHGSEDFPNHIDAHFVRGFFRFRWIGDDRQQRMEATYNADPDQAIASSPQFEAMKRAAAEKGMTLLPENVTPEFGTSAGSPLKDRPVLSGLVESLVDGKGKVLVLSRVEDLARSVRVCSEIQASLDQADIRFLIPGIGSVEKANLALLLRPVNLRIVRPRKATKG